MVLTCYSREPRFCTDMRRVDCIALILRRTAFSRGDQCTASDRLPKGRGTMRSPQCDFRGAWLILVVYLIACMSIGVRDFDFAVLNCRMLAQLLAVWLVLVIQHGHISLSLGRCGHPVTIERSGLLQNFQARGCFVDYVRASHWCLLLAGASDLCRHA